ncbi:hypothetical protein N665_0885s0006 [Sinapis alba]|nr:hypothetical protein N665_0885s0006 [Sinapis alba]
MFNLKHWLTLVICSLTILKAEGLLVNITFVRNAVAKGGRLAYPFFLMNVVNNIFKLYVFCCSFVWMGSPPAYHLHRDFYNWNRVKVRYCDGSSFTGDVQAVNPATNLHFRGARVWLAVMQELLAKERHEKLRECCFVWVFCWWVSFTDAL